MAGSPVWQLRFPQIDEVTFTRDGHVGRLTLHRPDKLNAQTPAMWLHMAELGDTCSARPVTACGCVVVEGEGRSFSAGIDITAFTGGGGGGGEPTGGGGTVRHADRRCRQHHAVAARVHVARGGAVPHDRQGAGPRARRRHAVRARLRPPHRRRRLPDGTARGPLGADARPRRHGVAAAPRRPGARARDDRHGADGSAPRSCSSSASSTGSCRGTRSTPRSTSSSAPGRRATSARGARGQGGDPRRLGPSDGRRDARRGGRAAALPHELGLPRRPRQRSWSNARPCSPGAERRHNIHRPHLHVSQRTECCLFRKRRPSLRCTR